jgi:hypothetical protein
MRVKYTYSVDRDFHEKIADIAVSTFTNIPQELCKQYNIGSQNSCDD